MTNDRRAALIEYLEPLVSEERREQMQRVLDCRTRHISVILEDVFQPHNAAAVLRSCECFGVQDVYVVEDRNHFRPSEDIARGADKWLTIQRYNHTHADNLGTCYRELRKAGYKIAATSFAEDAVSMHELPIEEPIAVLFGSEWQGVSDRAIESADYRVIIPMYGFTQSFNVSVSAALTLQVLTQRLRETQTDWHVSEDERQSLYSDWLLKSVRNPDIVLKRFEEL